MPTELYVTGDKLAVGDVIITAEGRAGAVLMEKYGWQARRDGRVMVFGTDKGVVGFYRPGQDYRIVRATDEEMDDAMGKNDDKPGKGDAQERADRLNELPTYQAETKGSKATGQPAGIEMDPRYDERDDDQPE